MLRASLIAFASLASVSAFAQDATPPPAEAPAAVDPLAEPRDLVEVAPNTKDNLTKAIKLYEERLNDPAVDAKKKADGWADVTRAYMRLGDLQSGKDAKIAEYTKGREAAKKALAINPNHADAIFWDMACLASTGRERGVMNSLFMLPDLRKGLGRVLEIDRNHSYAKQTLGEIDHSVPGIAGGSDERAEKAYLDVMARDPYFTPTMVNLAKFYRDKGKKDEAKKWAQKVLDTPKSSVTNDWKKFDKKEAKKVLDELAK
jgi:tetratricopeptide (TPR) repeat protein